MEKKEGKNCYEERIAFLLEQEDVKQCLTQIQEEEESVLEFQKQIAMIDGPTFQETPRAKAMEACFSELGLEDVTCDELGNVYGTLYGEDPEATCLPIVIEAHCDTVFPFGTAGEIRQENSVLYGPAISDNSRGLAVLYALVRTFKGSKIRTKRPIIFLATVREEGLGGFGGMKFFLETHPELEAVITLDGPDSDVIVYGGPGSKTQVLEFSGRGGHAYKAYGVNGNPVHAAIRAMEKIVTLELPSSPRTTCVISEFHSGSREGIHAIPQTASLSVNFRSEDQNILNTLSEQIMEAALAGAAEENSFTGSKDIAVTREELVDIKAVTQERTSQMVSSMAAVIKGLGMEPIYDGNCPTNASATMGAGVKGICIGGGGRAGGNHSVQEWFDTKDSYLGVQAAFLELLLLAEPIFS